MSPSSPFRFVVLEFDKDDARQSRRVRALLAGKGTSIGPARRAAAIARNLYNN